MQLVIDANIIASILITPKNKSCDLLFSENLKLYAPKFLLEEFIRHKQEILSKSELSEGEFNLAISLVFSRVRFIPFSDFEQFIPQAKEICPDPNDVEYFAVALKLACPIWSNDKAIKQQSVVRIISTTELLKEIGD